MDIVAQEKKTNKRYLPHTLTTRIGAVNLYRHTHDINFVLRRYHISKASLMRWNRQFDGTKESLKDKSHRPHSQHPNAHTEGELKWIRDYHRRTPNISICVLIPAKQSGFIRWMNYVPSSISSTRPFVRERPGTTER